MIEHYFENKEKNIEMIVRYSSFDLCTCILKIDSKEIYRNASYGCLSEINHFMYYFKLKEVGYCDEFSEYREAKASEEE